MLTREEVERRLKRWSEVKPDDPSYLRDSGQRDALETALAAMDERDALLAENRLLRDSLALVDDIDGWHLASNVRIALESAFLPRTAAEVARVRRLEAVLEAAPELLALVDDMGRFVGGMALQDYARFNEAPMKMRAALKAYREGKRPGGEV